MASVKFGIGVVGVVVVAFANVAPTWAQSDEVPRRLRERINRTLAGGEYRSAAAFGTEKKITPSDGAAYDYFGDSVAISGDTAIVGAFRDDDNVDQSGSAYVYQRDQGGADNWGRVTKLTASDGAVFDDFGRSVAISGETAIVGMPGNAVGAISGSAYVYQRNRGGADNWGSVTKITPYDAAPGDGFGVSVAISGDTAVVGASGDDDNGRGSGSAYVYRRDEGGFDNWGLMAKLTASDGAAVDSFGVSVAISGETAIVGAFRDEDDGFGSGSAYVYRKDQGGADNWGQVIKITASDAASFDYFGESVAISGDTAIVAAAGDDDISVGTGSAYVYQRDEGGLDTWGQVTKLTAGDPGSFDSFGSSVAISGDTAIVGAIGNDEKGSAYVYRRDEGGIDNWGQFTKITASDGEAYELFGGAVAISGDTAIVGAADDDDNGIASGSAYMYSSCSDDVDARYGDVAGAEGVCGPDGDVNLSDILSILNGFAGEFAEGCELVDIDIAGDAGSCVPNGVINLSDILGVLDAFQGAPNCCGD